MDRPTAAALLGVDPDSPLPLIRARYRSLLMQAHPDRSQHVDAAEQTMRLTAAYRVLRVGAPLHPPSESGPSRPDAGEPEHAEPAAAAPSHGERPAEPPSSGEPTLLGPTTIGLALPEPIAMRRLLDVAMDLGEVTYLERSTGLLEVVVEFVDAPTSSVVLTVVGSPGGSRVDCWVEPLSGGSAPPADAVTRLLLSELLGGQPAD